MRDFLKEIEQALKMYINLHSFARKRITERILDDESYPIA